MGQQKQQIELTSGNNIIYPVQNNTVICPIWNNTAIYTPYGTILHSMIDIITNTFYNNWTSINVYQMVGRK